MKRVPLFLLLLLLATVTVFCSVRVQAENPPTEANALWNQADRCLQLAQTGTAEDAAELAGMLNDERLCAYACTALINLPEKAGLKPLQNVVPELLAKGSFNNLMTVVNALGQLQDPSSVEVLKTIPGGDNTGLNQAVERALDKIATPKSQLVRIASVPLPNPLPEKPFEYTIDQVGPQLDALFSTDEPVQVKAKTFLESVCLTANPPESIVRILTDRIARTKDNGQIVQLIELLALIDDTSAAEALGTLSLQGNDAAVDAATKVLGNWMSISAAEPLLRIVKATADQVNIDQKYRIRALRGYIRLARQIGGISLYDREQMLARASELATRQEEKDLIADVYAKVIRPGWANARIFDGKTFAGWEGDTENTFKIEDGMFVCGSNTERNPRNEFLCTKISYRDFVLKVDCRILGQGGNAGVQFRSRRVPNHHEMIGFQADMTTDGVYFGSLYDESRRSRFLVSADRELIKKIFRPNDWNEYMIVCRGANITLYLNGVQTVSYTETDPEIPLEGIIGLQIHAGPPSQSFYRNISLERLD